MVWNKLARGKEADFGTVHPLVAVLHDHRATEVVKLLAGFRTAVAREMDNGMGVHLALVVLVVVFRRDPLNIGVDFVGRLAQRILFIERNNFGS